MISSRTVWVAYLIELSGIGFAQRPAIGLDGVVNAASYDAREIAPRSLVTIFGTNLAATTMAASTSQLPSALGGTIMQIDGVVAPLLYVSPTQINAQLPSALNSGVPKTARVVVTTMVGSSDPATVTISPRALGIFTLNSTGCGQGAALNVHADGSASINTPQTSFDPTKDVALTVFGTGLGYFPDVPDGRPFASSGKASSGGLFTGFIGRPDSNGSTQVLTSLYTGPAPGLVGQDQLNLQIPSGPINLPQGCHVPLYLTDFVYSASQEVAISVRDGGGPCLDPAADSLGLVEFKRTVISDGVVASEEDAVEVTFQSAPDLHFPAVPQENTSHSGSLQPAPVQCPDTAPRTLNAGTVRVQGPGVSIILAPANQNGMTIYRANVPTGILQGGDYQVSGLGGNDIGPFQVTAHIPAPIKITDNLSPGTALAGSQLSLHWTGSDTQSVLQEQLIVPSSSGVSQVGSAAVSTAAGSLDVPVWGSLFPVSSGPTYPTGPAYIIVTIQPNTTHLQAFTAPGLTLGGQVRWIYEYRYNGLTVK